MYRFVRVAAAIFLLCTMLPAHAQMKVRNIEEGIEANTEMVSIPGSVPTSLSFKKCGSCTFLTLHVDNSARYYIGKYEVSLADLRRYANRGTKHLDVFYEPKSLRLTRMILRTELDAADAAKVSRPAS